MKVNVDFQFAKVYDVQEKIDVVLGQKFSFFTDADHTPVLWFSDHDQVLSITDNGSSADIEATALGESIVLIMDSGLGIIKKLDITVVDAIVEPAKSLNVSADSPILKP